jgi:hypothetical protein
MAKAQRVAGTRRRKLMEARGGARHQDCRAGRLSVLLTDSKRCVPG